MKTAKMLSVATAALFLSTPAMAAEAEGEIGYSKGALGYDALVAGDNQAALQQLETANGLDEKDPARLINLGQAYARTGRAGDAARMFMAAMNSNRSFDVVLADGSVMNSRKAAEVALNRLYEQLASR